MGISVYIIYMDPRAEYDELMWNYHLGLRRAIEVVYYMDYVYLRTEHRLSREE